MNPTNLQRKKSDGGIMRAYGGEFGSKHNKRMVSYAGMNEIKITNMQDWKKYKRISRSMNRDDFELLENYDDSSSSSEEEESNKEFHDEPDEDNEQEGQQLNLEEII